MNMTRMGRPPSDNPRNKMLQVRMTEQEYRSMHSFASSRRQTLSDMVRERFDDALTEGT